jgi:mannosyltransferase
MRDRELRLLIGITILAAALRFSTLGIQSYWHDEAVTVLRVLKPGFGATMHAVSESESTPPLYYMLAWVWSKAFGTSEFGLRSLSALFGTITVPVAFYLTRRLASRRAALIVAALVATSPWLIWYSQEARSYALLVLLTGLSLLAFVRALDDPVPGRLAAWTIASSLALTTHYFAGFVVGLEAAWLLTRHRLHRWVAASVLGASAFAAALLPLALHQLAANRTQWISRIGLPSRVFTLPGKFVTGEHGSLISRVLLIPVGLLAIIGLWLALTRTAESDRRGAVLALALGVAVLLMPLALALVGIDYFNARNVISAWLLIAAAVGSGFGAAKAGKPGLVAAACLCAVSLAITVAVEVDAKLQRADWRDVAGALPRGRVDRAIVTPFIGDDPMKYYLPGLRRMPSRGAAVCEVDLVGWPKAAFRTPGPPAAGLSEFEQRKIATLSLVRFRSASKVWMTPRRLASDRLGSLHAAVLLESGTSRSAGPPSAATTARESRNTFAKRSQRFRGRALHRPAADPC